MRKSLPVSWNVRKTWQNLPPLKTVRGLPFRDLFVHARFLLTDSDGGALCAYYAVEGERQGSDWLFWGLVSAPSLRLGVFTLAGMQMAAQSRGAELRYDAAFVKRPMAEVMEGEGARCDDGE